MNTFIVPCNLAGLSQRTHGFESKPEYLGFMVGKGEIETVFPHSSSDFCCQYYSNTSLY